MKREHVLFYAMGREADALDEGDLDVDDILDKIEDGADLRETIQAVVVTLAAPLAHGTEKKEWLAEHREEIAEAGGDSEEAFRCFMKGRMDQHSHELETEVVERMLADDDDDEDEEDEEEEEEETDEEE